MTAREWASGTLRELERVSLQPEGMKPRMGIARRAPRTHTHMSVQSQHAREGLCWVGWAVRQFLRHRSR